MLWGISLRIFEDGAPSARLQPSGRTGLDVLFDRGVVNGAPSARLQPSGRTGLDVLFDRGVVAAGTSIEGP